MKIYQCPTTFQRKNLVTSFVIPAKAGIQVVNKLLKKVWDLDPGFRRDDVIIRKDVVLIVGLLIFQIFFFHGAGHAAKKKKLKSMPISIGRYVELALEKSLRSQSNEETLQSNRYGLKSTLRDLTWPRLTLTATETRSESDTDTGTKSETGSTTGRVSVTQPFLTGTDVTVSGTWTHSETETNTSGVITESDLKNRPEVKATVNQPLYVFLRNEKLRRRKEALLGWENDQDSHHSQRLNIEFEARGIYYRLLLDRERVAVERKKYQSAQKVHKITRALVNAGKKAKVELLRADIRAKSDLRRIQNVENSYQKSLNSAKDFVLISAEREVRLISDLKYIPFKIKLKPLIKVALEENPSLRNARRNVTLSKISLQRTKEGNRPDLDLTGTYTKTLNRSDPNAPIDPYSWSVQMGLTWPIFDATQTKLSVRRQEISLRNTKRNSEDQKRNLKVDIKNAYLDVKRTEEQIKDFSKHRESGVKSLNATRLQYKNGIARLTDVFDAENQLRDLALEYLGLLVEFNVARDRLSLLVGRDITQLGESP